MTTLESYRYSALDESGNKVSGTEKAASVSAAHLMLIQRGLQPIDVKEHKSVLKFEITKKTVTRKEIMHFSRQLSVFVEAGIPIMEALELISEETTDKLLKKVLLDMVGELQAGDTFAAAAGAHPEAFPRYYVAVLESAELTGTLDTVLLELATYLETDIEARSAITSALIYPAVVAVMAVVTVIVLATFVLPKFTDVLRVAQREAAASDADVAEHLGLHQHVVVGDRRQSSSSRSSRSSHYGDHGGAERGSTRCF